MKAIPLSHGLRAFVDDADYPSVAAHTWTAQKGKAGCWYAYRFDYGSGRKRKVYLHQAILGVTRRIDHRNGVGLDCQRYNLRVCTNQENMQNMRVSPERGSSRFKGVAWFKRDERWRAYIVKDAKQRHLGYFDDECAAARAYDAAASEMFGGFASLNFRSAA